MPSTSIQQRVYETRVHDIDELRQICCVCGITWSSRWLTTQLTNGQHTCVLVFLPIADIFEHTSWLSICFLCRPILNEFYASYYAWCGEP